MIELDAMISTLQLVLRSDWVAILSGMICAADIGRETGRVINPIYDPPLIAEFVVISPARRTLSTQAQLFLEASKPKSHASRTSGHRPSRPPLIRCGHDARPHAAEIIPTPARRAV